jgi:alpha-tubulin suppressor-like RCC1 family protein
MTTNFQFNNGGTITDFDDAFISNDLFVNGGLWLWGQNSYGQIGNNTTLFVLDGYVSPVQTISGGSNWKQVSNGGNTSAAIKTDGTLWLWGYNFYGQLGINNTLARSSPVQTISGGANWKQVACGTDHVACIKTDGTLWLWGNNGVGQLGNNNTTRRSSPVQTVSGGTNWKQVSCANAYTGAIKTDGTLWLWGQGTAGALGNNQMIDVSSPVQTIAGGTNWRKVVTAVNVAALKTDGTLWLWGNNFQGRLGDNTIVSKSSPVQTVSAGNNWKDVAVYNSLTAAIKTDGTLWLWGGNTQGELGDNTIISKSSPVQTISGGTNWKQCAMQGQSSGGIKTDGTLWVWGANRNGILGNGDGTFTFRSSPVQTAAGGTNWQTTSTNGGTALTNAGIRNQFY